jgi:hypothetical protein
VEGHRFHGTLRSRDPADAVREFVEGRQGEMAYATKKPLSSWNVGLQTLAPAILQPDALTSLVLYGDTWTDSDRLRCRVRVSR